MVWQYTHKPLRQQNNGSTTLYMSNMDKGSSLRWMDISLNPDVMASFLLHMWTTILKYGANLASVMV